MLEKKFLKIVFITFLSTALVVNLTKYKSQQFVRIVNITFEDSIYNIGKFNSNPSNRSIVQQLLFDEFNSIKNSLNKAFLSVSNPIDYCSYDFPKNEQNNTIDVEDVLDQFDLGGLVEFYSNASLKLNLDQRNLNYSQPKEIDKISEYFELWNSSDVNLLNATLPQNSTDLIDFENIKLGGHWKPATCLSRFKVAIIIPFRDRLPHLKVITNYLHMFLQRQSLDYRIFVVEPTIPLNISFNKGRVMNSAYLEVLKVDPKIDCIIFHDVDLIPEDARNIYTCSKRPKHLSVAIDKFEYILPYQNLVGGVLSIRTDQYKLTNGYSNLYWGWGGEDDDFAQRIKHANLAIQRPPASVARYKMIKHKPQSLNNNRYKLLKKTRISRFFDGVHTVKYTVIDIRLFNLFTYILIDVGLP